ncbi:MAG: alpha/beta hydrolase [Chloroflexi bacterium]|nr:MAG: alpha/beta hydrolase [Chloroflexota bacterium]
MPRVSANGIEIEYETFGDPKAQPMLLIGGLGSQLLSWDEDFCALLAGHGFHVIRFDNRDSGLSTWVDDAYTLDDMAADAAGLLDALGIPAAHVVGASMGGFIAQLVALNHPDRVLTLTSIMSGPNGDDQVQPTTEGSGVLMAPAPDTREERIAMGVWARQALLGPADPFDEPHERARVTRAVDRAYHPAGFGRQLGAVIVARGRLERLGSVSVPTLVIHGDADILVPVENGRRVAAAVPGARLMEIEGMGHDLPRRVWPQVADAIASLAGEAAPAC